MTNEQSTDDLLKNMQMHMGAKKGSSVKKAGSRLSRITSGIGDWFVDHKKAMIYTGLGTVAAIGVGTWLTLNYATKRQDYPQRDVLFTVQQERFYAGGEEVSSAENIDRFYTSKVFVGNLAGQTTRTNENIATIEHKLVDNFKYYFLKDQNNNIIASGSTNREILQPGISIFGDYISQQHTIKFSETNPIQGGMMIEEIEREYFTPDRTKIDIMEVNGKKTLYNKITETRAIPQGLVSRKWGRAMRRSTNLERYTAASDAPKVKELLGLIESYNSKNGLTDSKRADILDNILDVEKEIPKKMIYNSMEDGIIDWMPEGSRIYLNHKSTFMERRKLKARSAEGVFRVSTQWDLFPGNIAGLNKWRYESADGSKVFSLFDKYNNGGYTILDSKGEVAQIKIVDFFFKYDRDLIFEYYMDKNGDGKLDHEKELVGRVLYKQKGSRQNEDPESTLGQGQSKKDATYNYLYVFMGGYSSDSAERYKDFLRCGWIEAAMPDQINRGFGKHSYIGWIKDARANIILYHDRQPKNLSRVIVEESPITATEDIYNLLKDAKRPYADKYGLEAGLISPVVKTPAQAKPASSTTKPYQK